MQSQAELVESPFRRFKIIVWQSDRYTAAMTDQHTIRQRINADRKALDADTLSRHADACASQVKTLIPDSAPLKVAAYRAVRGEMDPKPAIEWLWAQGHSVYLPIVDGEAMWFARWEADQPLVKRGMGLYEPDIPRDQWLHGMDLDVILAPLVAFDRQCQRIGMGGGFYDRTFAPRKHGATSPTLIGIAHALQETATIAAQDWDVPLDYIVTEAEIIQRPS